MLRNAFSQKLKKILSQSRQIPLAVIKERAIKRFSKSLYDIHWRPDYLFEDIRNKKYIAFTIIYDAEFFPNVLSQEVEKAKANCAFDFFFIVENEALLNIFEEKCRERGFGLLLNREASPLLIRDAIKSVSPGKIADQYVGHFPFWLIDEIGKINLGNSKFRTALKDFSKEYFKLKNKKVLNWQKEEELVKNTIVEILRSDVRYTSGIDSFEILSRFEGFWSDIRDHYFHSFHIFLLGLLILDHYKDEFISYCKNIFPKYRTFSLEFVWLLTSIFHDVGYPIAKLNDLKEDIYGVSTIPSEKEITNVWDDPVYKENLKQLISFLKFSLSNKKHKTDWYADVFGTKDDLLDQIFRESFYDSHGVAGCFRFLVDIFSEARQEDDVTKRVFWVNHIYPAGLSIALHDRKFRQRLSQAGIKNIKLSRFPFAILLTYLDTLQEDRRERFLCIEEPELLRGFKYNGRVIVVVDEKIAQNYPRFGKLKIECKEFINFADCDGVIFEYPEILLI